MARILIVPDIHLKPEIFFKAISIYNKGAYDGAVILGDLVDDWGQENNLELYEETFDAAINFVKKVDNVLFCYGNHDLSYVWKERESGYSENARATVLEGIERFKDALGMEKMAYIHRIDNVLFSHAGLTEKFVSKFIPNAPEDVDELLKTINRFDRNEIWDEGSPIWARPQDGRDMLYAMEYMQVVGHTPVEEVDEFWNLLSVDTFSTSGSGYAIGNRKFAWVDTVQKSWGYAE